MTEQEERQSFIDAAVSYRGTPYHHAGMIKGAGVDCLTLLVCAAKDSGMVDQIEVPNYARHWNLHRGSEEYLHGLYQYCDDVDPPALPGDIIIWKFARSFSHAAIVIEWPRIIHAYNEMPVEFDDAEKNQNLVTRPSKLVSLWSR